MNTPRCQAPRQRALQRRRSGCGSMGSARRHSAHADEWSHHGEP